MRTIHEQAQNANASKIALLAPYIDSIELSTPQWLRPELLACVRVNCRSMRVNEIRDRHNPERVRRHLLKINQPSRLCIELLQRYKKHDPKLSLYRVHPAFDVLWTYEGVTREEMIEVLTKLVHLRYRRATDEFHDEETSQYWIRAKGRKSRPYRNLLFYDHRVSKVTGEIDALHLESRLERKRSVQTAGIDDPADIPAITPANIFAQQIAIKDIRGTINKWIRKTCAYYADDDPAYIEMRVRALFERFGFDHASTFAKYHPKQFERLKHWDCVDIEDDWNWVTADVQCEEKMGNMRCLLPPPPIKPKIRRERLIPRERL